jgi:hypothetical protein
MLAEIKTRNGSNVEEEQAVDEEEEDANRSDGTGTIVAAVDVADEAIALLSGTREEDRRGCWTLLKLDDDDDDDDSNEKHVEDDDEDNNVLEAMEEVETAPDECGLVPLRLCSNGERDEPSTDPRDDGERE